MTTRSGLRKFVFSTTGSRKSLPTEPKCISDSWTISISTVAGISTEVIWSVRAFIIAYMLVIAATTKTAVPP